MLYYTIWEAFTKVGAISASRSIAVRPVIICYSFDQVQLFLARLPRLGNVLTT